MPRGRSIGAIEAGPVSEDADSLADEEPSRTRRWWSWPLATGLLLVLASTAARWRDLGAGLATSGWGVRGSEVGAVAAVPRQIYSAWSLPFSGAGLGEVGQSPPWLLPLSALGWVVEHLPAGPDGPHTAGVATAWLLCASGVLSVLSAYVAARVVTRSRLVAAVLALGWAGAAPLAVGLEAGRVGPVVVHVLAPLMVAGAVRSVRRGSAGTSAAFGVGVLTALATWFVPLSAIVALGAGLIVAVTAHGWARLRAVPILLLPPALLGPQILQLWEHPILVWGGPGATDTASSSVTAWQALMLHPGGPVSLSLWWLAPAWLLAVVGAAGPRRGTRGGVALALSLVALIAVSGAVLIGRVELGELPSGYPDAGLDVRLWSGTLLSVGGAALMLAAGAGATELIRLRKHAASRSGYPAAAASVVLAVAGTAALAGLAIQAAAPLGARLTVADAPLPAVVVERTAGTDGVRMIELTPQASPTSHSQTSQGHTLARVGYGVSYDLVGEEPDPWLRDRTRDLVTAERRGDAGKADGEQDQLPYDPVASVVAALVDTTDTTVVDQEPLEQGLANLAVEFVMVDAKPGHPLLAQLDALPSLTRVSSTQGVGLWWVVPEAVGSRVWAESASGSGRSLPLRDVRAAGVQIPDDSEIVAISQAADWAELAEVRLNGRLLDARPGFPVRYAVPGGGFLTVDLPPADQRWWWATLALALLSVFFAMPAIGTSRRRTR